MTDSMSQIPSNVFEMRGLQSQPGVLDKGGEPPDDGGMEARIAKLEDFVVDARERLTKIETRLDQTATKADLSDLKVEIHKGFNDQIKWVVGTAIVLGATALTVMTFVLNNATPKGGPPQSQTAPPIVIQVPSYQAAPQTAPSPKQ